MIEVWDYIRYLPPNLYGLVEGWLSKVIPAWAVYIIMGLLVMVGIVTVTMIVVMAFIWLELRSIGRIQVRRGPNRVGPWGLLQPIADAVKIMIKEDIVPVMADRWLYFLAPILAFSPALLALGVVPFGDGQGLLLADLNVGLLFVFAITLLEVPAIAMAGWSSYNKYSLMAAMRVVAQMISYEVPVVLSVLGVVMMVGSLSLGDIVKEQDIPFILLQPLGFLVFFMGVSAELNRTPFDLLEADSEIVAGYHIEYSGMKFALFYLGEYASTIVVSAVAATLFLGGWKGPILPPYIWFLIKLFVVFLLFVWARATLPRVRIDQVMALAWKFLFPLALFNVFLTAVEVLLPWPRAAFIVPNFIIAGILVVLLARPFPVVRTRVRRALSP